MDTRQLLKCNSCKKPYKAGCIYPPSKSKCKYCGHKGATKVIRDSEWLKELKEACDIPTEGNEGEVK